MIVDYCDQRTPSRPVSTNNLSTKPLIGMLVLVSTFCWLARQSPQDLSPQGGSLHRKAAKPSHSLMSDVVLELHSCGVRCTFAERINWVAVR